MSEVIIETTIPPIELPGNPGATESSELPLEGEPGYDPEAPLGRNKDGSPRKKRGRKPGSTNSGTTRTRGFAFNQEDLAQQIVEMTIPVAFVSPLASAVIEERAERTAKALITLARNSPRVAKALAGFQSGTAYAELLFLPIGIAVAVAVDYGKLTPDNFLARKYNIDTYYYQFVGEAQRVTPTGNNGYHPDEVPNVQTHSGFFNANPE